MGVFGGKTAASSARARSGGCCLCLSVVSLFAGVVLFLLGIWGAHLKQRFTPVYRDIECVLSPPSIEGITFDGPIWDPRGMQIRLLSSTECTNPNPYSVKLFSKKSSPIYMGEEKVPVGNLTGISESTLAANGKGQIKASIVITPTAKLMDQMIGRIIRGVFGGRQSEIPMYFQNNLVVNVDVKFWFGHVRVTRAVNKDCGMNFMMEGSLSGPKGGLGPMTCADDWDELVLNSDAASASTNGVLDFSADGLGGDELDDAEHLLTVSTGVMMGVGFGVGFILLASGGLCLARFLRSRRLAEAEGAPTGAPAAQAKGAAPPSSTVEPSQEAATFSSEV